MDDTQIPYLLKKQLVNWLKENDYIIADSFEQVKIANHLQIKYPNYNWSNFDFMVDKD